MPSERPRFIPQSARREPIEGDLTRRLVLARYNRLTDPTPQNIEETAERARNEAKLKKLVEEGKIPVCTHF